MLSDLRGSCRLTGGGGSLLDRPRALLRRQDVPNRSQMLRPTSVAPLIGVAGEPFKQKVWTLQVEDRDRLVASFPTQDGTVSAQGRELPFD